MTVPIDGQAFSVLKITKKVMEEAFEGLDFMKPTPADATRPSSVKGFIQSKAEAAGTSCLRLPVHWLLEKTRLVERIICKYN